MKLTKEQSLKEIAELVKVSIVGNPDISVKGINEIHKVVEGDITFVDNPKYYKSADFNESILKAYQRNLKNGLITPFIFGIFPGWCLGKRQGSAKGALIK